MFSVGSIDFAKKARDRRTFIGRLDTFSWECITPVMYQKATQVIDNCNHHPENPPSQTGHFAKRAF